MSKSVQPKKVIDKTGKVKWEVEDEAEFDRLSRMSFLERNIYDAEQARNNPKKHVLDNDDLARMNVPSEFWSWSRKDMTVSAQKAITNYERNFLTFEKAGGGLFIFGEPGRGKTGVAVALLRVARENYRSGYFIRVPELRDAIARELRQPNSEASIAQRVRTAQFLVLDSLSERDLTLPYFGLDDLMALVGMRGENHLPTLVTTSLRPNNKSLAAANFFETVGKYLLHLEVTGANRHVETTKHLGKLLRGDE